MEAFTNKVYYLIYIDILGFVNIAENIEKIIQDNPSIRVQLYPEEIRHIFIERIQSKINNLQTAKKINICKNVTTDSWLLFTDDLTKVFYVIYGILQAKLPMEIAVDKKVFEAHPINSLINQRDEVMKYLKTRIIEKYHYFYKNNFKKSLKETFILLTEEKTFAKVKNFAFITCLS